VTGNLLRSTKVMQGAWGYNVAEVGDLVARAAAEMDDGRPAGPLIENAALSRARFNWTSAYDVEAVD
jgi:hypothetical protein